jgi:diaminopimelate epimerase
VKIFNPDGSEAENGGNGVCIFAKYLRDAGYITQDSFTLHTLGGPVNVFFNNAEGTDVTVSMGKLSFEKEDVGCVDTPEQVVDVPLQFGEETFQCTCVSIGNPHCVIPMYNVYKKRVCEIGKFSEHAKYFPNRINTQIVKVLDRSNIQIEIFERGAGYTLASGSSSCAAAGAVHKLGLVDSDVCVHMPGGKLQIHMDKDWNATLTGNVCSVGKMILTDEFIRNNQIGR